MKENEEYQRLEDYLMGRLDQSAHQEMEEILGKDKGLKEEAEQLRMIMQGISRSGRGELKNRLQELEKSFEENNNTRSISWWSYGIAASVVLLLAGSILFFLADSGQDLNTWYEPYPVLDQSIMRSGDQPLDDLQDALQLYETGKYISAAESLQKLQVEEEMEEYVRFYLASSWQAGLKTEKAIPIYREIAENGKIFSIQAQWYLSLCYIQLGKTEEAKQTLQELSSGSSSYAKKANDLLESLP